MKREVRKEVGVQDIININPTQWIQVDKPVISKIGDYQVRVAHKQGKYFCYVNIDKNTKGLKSRFFCDESNGRENYTPLKKVNYRNDGTISSVTIFKGESKTQYCMDKSGTKSFKVVEY